MAWVDSPNHLTHCYVAYKISLETDGYYAETLARNDYDLGIVIILLILLVFCGDIHPNPGPAQNSFVARFTNIRHLRANWDFLEHDLLTTRPQIFCVSESFLNSKIPVEPFAIPGDSFFRRDRPNDSSWGGLIVFYSYSIICIRMRELEYPQLEMICLKFHFQGDWCSYSAYTNLHLLMTQYMTLSQRKFILYRNSIQNMKLLLLETWMPTTKNGFVVERQMLTVSYHLSLPYSTTFINCGLTNKDWRGR